MSKSLTLIPNDDPFWRSVAATLDGQIGKVVSESTADGMTSYNAEFPTAVFGGIPCSVCEVTEVPDPESPSA